MNSLLFLAVGAAILMLGAIKHNKTVHGFLDKYSRKTQYLPQVVSVLIISSQISELLKVLEHDTIVNVVTALFILALIVATRPGTESELH